MAEPAEPDVRSLPLQRAKDALLRALDQLEEAEEQLGEPPEYVELVVVYSVGIAQGEDGAFHEIGGWSATPGPHWAQAALLRRAATAFETDNPMIFDDEDDDEDDGE